MQGCKLIVQNSDVFVKCENMSPYEPPMSTFRWHGFPWIIVIMHNYR